MKEQQRRKTTVVVGVDPGKEGAAVALRPGDAYAVQGVATGRGDYCPRGTYDLQGIVRFLRESAPDLVVVERQHAMPGQGVVSCLSIGYGWALWEMAAAALAIPWTAVTAQVWQKEVLRGAAGKTTKDKSISVASALLPHLDLRATPGARRPNSGVADAACMVIWAVRSGKVGATKEDLG